MLRWSSSSASGRTGSRRSPRRARRGEQLEEPGEQVGHHRPHATVEDVRNVLVRGILDHFHLEMR